MNEIIAKLAEQAAQESALLENEVNLEVTVEDRSYSIPGSFIDKFAKLLLVECMELCVAYGESGDGYTLASDISEHFDAED